MIHTNELRIGNLIQVVDGRLLKVYEVKTKSARCSYLMDGQLKYSIVSDYDLFPISITEDLHNKFGSVKDGFGNFEYQICKWKILVFSGDYLWLREASNIQGIHNSDDNIITLFNKDMKKRDMYVHELQNLYFALRNSELNIEL